MVSYPDVAFQVMGLDGACPLRAFDDVNPLTALGSPLGSSLALQVTCVGLIERAEALVVPLENRACPAIAPIMAKIVVWKLELACL